MIEPLQPYEPLRSLDTDLFVVDGEWYESAFRRRMTVVRLKDKSLVLHSAIQLEPEDLLKLEKLGRIGTIVVPNVFHGSEAAFYSARYPDAKVYVPAKIAKKCAGRMKVTGSLEKDWPHEKELPCFSFDKTLVGESVFVHIASKTLIVTDLAFNMKASDFKNPWERRIFGEWNGILEVFGPSKLTRWVAARNRDHVGSVLKKLKKHEFERVIMNHGHILEKDGKKRFLESYRRIYGPGLGI
jgi:hypothetical protein